MKNDINDLSLFCIFFIIMFGLTLIFITFMDNINRPEIYCCDKEGICKKC